MAWSSASLSANELAWSGADKPMLSSNALQAAKPGDISAKWVTGTVSGTSASADDTDSDYPAAQLWDGFPGRRSKGTNAATSWSIVIDASSSPIEFDWWGVIGHNLRDITISTMGVTIADSGDFASRPSAISSVTPYSDMANGHRYADLSLSPALGSTIERFSDVEWIRVWLTCSSGVPEIGQLVFGRSRQQQFQPTMPFNRYNQASSMHFISTPGGARLNNPRYKARRELNASYKHSLTSLQTDALAWWSDTRDGCDPFFYHDAPSGSPIGFHMMMHREQGVRYPRANACRRELFIDAIEQGPTFLSLE